jgi:hypothetical protein
MKIYSADLETTVYEGQTSTEAWASALVALDSDEPLVFHSLKDTLDYLDAQDEDAILYYHNLKFDGNFWLSFLITEMGFKQGLEDNHSQGVQPHFIDRKELKNNQVIYLISSMGQWYTVTFKYHSHIYTLKDSLKLLPFTLKEIGKAFKTEHQKLDMEYEGERYAGCEITPSEMQYIKNDVLVLKEALNIMFAEGHKRLTIGSCCLEEYKKLIGSYDWGVFFPRLDTIEIDPNEYGASTADEYIRNSYRGGWCYLVKGCSGKTYHNGTTADVNSLYPSMMHSESGNVYPLGKPNFWKGSEIPRQALLANRYYFIRIRCRFYLKHGKLPFIQIKHNYKYKSTEMLETSDVYNKKDGKYYSQYYDKDGNLQNTIVELTLTKTDYILLREHYDLYDFEILDGCWFFADKGIFDPYIDKYKKIKMENKGAKRTEAKLFLNNLYGKMATSTISSFKYAVELEDGSLGYKVVAETNKDPVYIPVGSAITSYSRNFTIRAAQANFFGADKPGFKYADTDSIHCDLTPDKIKGIRVSETEFCCWKLEARWDIAKFIRQKTYVEHVTHEDLKPIEKPYYNIKCAGMPDSCKNLLLSSMGEREPTEKEKKKYEEFLKEKRTLDDFKIGLKIPSKLLPRNIKGGVVLVETEFTMREIYL